ncbi:acetyltransferase [Citrobacter braakii]|nr:acetyltransferase [Citrobacter braakii]
MCFFSIKTILMCDYLSPDTPQAITCIHALGNLRQLNYFFRWLK